MSLSKRRTPIDYSLMVDVERVRFQSDFSSAHWLHQLICQYESQDMNKLRRDAYERVMRVAVKFGCAKALALAQTFPEGACFPQFVKLSADGWAKTRRAILADFKQHELNRFNHLKNGD